MTNRQLKAFLKLIYQSLKSSFEARRSQEEILAALERCGGFERTSRQI